MRILSLCLMLCFADSLAACCMVPKLYAGDVDQAQQQVVVMHANGHQEMIIRVAPFFQPKSRAGGRAVVSTERSEIPPPDHIVWVITVPSKPTGYAMADRDSFEQSERMNEGMQLQAFQQWKESHPAEPKSGAAPAAAEKAGPNSFPGLSVSAGITVGPYGIVEVRALGLEALGELNNFLREKGFPEEDADHMAYFVKNNFTFLVIHITPPQGQATLGQQLDLEPLCVGFDTSRPYYPGKFSSRQGNFKLHLHLITSEPLETASLKSMQQRLRDGYRARITEETQWEMGPWQNLWTNHLYPAFQKAWGKTKQFDGVTRWYSNLVTSDGFNPLKANGDPTIWDWSDDVFFALGGPADLQAGWYYGNGEKPLMRRIEENKMIIFLALGSVIGLVCLMLVARGSKKSRRMPDVPTQ